MAGAALFLASSLSAYVPVSYTHLLADENAPAAAVDRAMETFGQLDILFSNAGIGANALVAQMTDEAWDRVQAVNLRAAFRLAGGGGGI